MPMVAWHWPMDVEGINSVACDPGTGFGCIPFNGTSNVTRSKIYRRSYYASISYTGASQTPEELHVPRLMSTAAAQITTSARW